MFIVTKLIVLENRTEIIKVVDSSEEFDDLIAYSALITDALKNKDNYSIKNIDKNRVEVYHKSIFGNTLELCYELHEIDDEKTEEDMEIN